MPSRRHRLEPAGVDDEIGGIADARATVVAIASQTGEVGDERGARPRQAIEQRRLADVGTPDETSQRSGEHGAVRRRAAQRTLTENTAPPVLCQTAPSPDLLGWAVAAVPSVATRPTRLPSLLSSR